MENMGWLILSVVIFPLVVVVVGYLLKKGIDKSFKGWEKYNDLREKNLLDWQKTWQAKVCQVAILCNPSIQMCLTIPDRIVASFGLLLSRQQ